MEPDEGRIASKGFLRLHQEAAVIYFTGGKAAPRTHTALPQLDRFECVVKLLI